LTNIFVYRVRRIHWSWSLLGVILLAGCNGPKSPTAPSDVDVLSSTTSTANYDFRYSSGDAVDGPRQEAFHDWLLAYLGFSTTRRIQYFKYRDPEHMRRLRGVAANGDSDPPAFAVHSIFPWDQHEAIHVYTALIGRPSDFFNEGIAVALSYDPLGDRFVSIWRTVPIHDIARNLRRNGTLPRIAFIAETDPFRRLNDDVSYPVSGSFISFMLDQSGAQAMKAFFQTSSRFDRLATIETRFRASFGASLQEAEARWHVFLEMRD
jgi:hypothetical protein